MRLLHLPAELFDQNLCEDGHQVLISHRNALVVEREEIESIG